MNIKEGTEIYYRGDMANMEGFGVITKITTDKWGTFFSTKLEDGREQKRVPINMINTVDTGNGMTRFCTKEAYETRRKKAIEDFMKRYSK